MTQSRIDSVMEVTVNIGIGLAISVAANAIVLPTVLGIRVTGAQNVFIAGIFTVISVVRQYVLRRLFNGRSPWMWMKARWERRYRPHEVVRSDGRGQPMNLTCGYMPGRDNWRKH